MKPNYILRINEVSLVSRTTKFSKIRPIVWCVVVVILVASFIFNENIFSELSWTVRGFLVALVIGTFFANSYDKVPSPMEIQFYDDYLMLYREKHYYSNKVVRKEYDKFFYKDIKSCQYRVKTERINFYGIVEGTWYNYQKNGELSERPSYHKTTDSIRYFYTTFSKDIDIVKEIESNSPIKVTVENN